MYTTKKNVGVYRDSRLGAAIFNAGISIYTAAKVLGVSRQTIYSWFDLKTNISYANGLKRDDFCRALEELEVEKRLPNIQANREIIAFISTRMKRIADERPVLIIDAA